MRQGFVVAVATCVAVGLGAFFFGVYEGSYRTEVKLKSAWSDLNAQSSAASFLAATRAIELLHEGDAAKSEAILTVFASLQVSPLMECSRSASCSAYVGSLLPARERLRGFEQPNVAPQPK